MLVRSGVLDRVKLLRYPLNIPYLTNQMVADYYQVDYDTIHRVVQRHRSLFEGLLSIQGKDLATFKKQNMIRSRAPIMTLYPYEVILKIGVFLNDSEVTNKLKSVLSLSQNKELIELLDLNRSALLKKQGELERILNTTFKGLLEIKKYIACGPYTIDFVIKKNIAIECDEYAHTNRIQVSTFEISSFG